MAIVNAFTGKPHLRLQNEHESGRSLGGCMSRWSKASVDSPGISQMGSETTTEKRKSFLKEFSTRCSARSMGADALSHSVTSRVRGLY